MGVASLKGIFNIFHAVGVVGSVGDAAVLIFLELVYAQGAVFVIGCVWVSTIGAFQGSVLTSSPFFASWFSRIALVIFCLMLLPA